MSRPDRPNSADDGNDDLIKSLSPYVTQDESDRAFPLGDDSTVIELVLQDARLTDISGPMFGAELPIRKLPENTNDQNVIEIHRIDLIDPLLRYILAQRAVPVERRAISSTDRLRTLVVRVLLSTFVTSVLLLLAIAIYFAIAADDISAAAKSIGELLRAAADFLKVVFGGSVLGLILVSLFTRRPPRPPDGNGDRHGPPDRSTRRDE